VVNCPEFSFHLREKERFLDWAFLAIFKAVTKADMPDQKWGHFGRKKKATRIGLYFWFLRSGAELWDQNFSGPVPLAAIPPQKKSGPAQPGPHNSDRGMPGKRVFTVI